MIVNGTETTQITGQMMGGPGGFGGPMGEGGFGGPGGEGGFGGQMPGGH
jgi:hypothetical protein